MTWEKKRIRDFADVYDGPHATPKEATNGPIFLGIKNMRPEGGMDLTDIRHISDSEFEKWTKRVTPRKDDIVLSYEATLHRYAIIPETFIGCLGRRMALVRVNDDEVYHKFLYYTFLSDAWKGIIDANKLTGATVDRISITDFPDYTISIPPLHTQHKIASILSTYDDLIENNLKRIKLLEEKAQFHYKELMLELSYANTKQEVFIKDCLAFYIGGGWGEEDYREKFTESAYVIRGTDIPNTRVGNVSDIPLRFHKDSNLASRKMQIGDIVFEVSNGQISNIGRTVIISQRLLGQFDKPVMCASFAKLIRVNEKVTPEFFYLYLNEGQENGLLYQYKSNSANGINNFAFETFIDEVKIAIPKENELKAFTDKVYPIFNLISTLGEQNSKLKEARDILLPKLMNGRIEV